MGYSASQGSSNVCGDETVAFDVPPCTLPVTLIDFTAAAADNKVALKWTTAEEVNSKEFTVEFSPNNTNWTVVGTLPAANTVGTHQYSMFHYQPVNGANYYRLKMVDKDGSFKYSKVDVVMFTGKGGGFTVYPNPVKDLLYAELYNVQAQKVAVQITDVAGRVISEQQVQLQAGNNVFQVNTATLSKGTYMILVNGATTKQVKQFIKD
jgi:hypothetical protein